MSSGEIVLVSISGLGVIHGLFLAVFLWIYQKGNQLSNRILSILLVVLSFRIGKSVFLEFAENLDVKMIFIGLGTLMAIGPLFYLYTLSCLNKTFKINPKQYLHFIPSVLGVSFGFWIEDHHQETLPILLFLFLFLTYYLHLLAYLLMSFIGYIRKKRAELNEEKYALLRLLFWGLIIVWIVYVLNLVDEFVPYVVGPIIYTVVAYTISFIVFHKGYIEKTGHDKYKTNPVSDEQSNELFNQLQELISTKKLYRQTDLTLKSLSQQLHVSTQVLSLVINQRSKTNFNTYINEYRIAESIKLFEGDQYENYTIAAIAYEVGFNSISSFNSAFKKQTGKTPLAYRKDLSK